MVGRELLQAVYCKATIIQMDPNMARNFLSSLRDYFSGSEADVRSNQASVINLSGVKIPLNMPVLSDNILKSMRNGDYEYQEQRQLPGIVRQGERVLELGVGIGFIASLILRHENTEAYLGFEANPDLLPCIHEVFELNGVDGEICNAALIHDPAVTHLDFYKRPHFWASSLSPEPWAYESKVAIPARQFNAVIAEFRPTLIVCDIEGGELELFRHADLSGVKRVYLEIHQSVLGRRGIKELFDVLSARSFHYDQFHSTGAVVLFTHVSQE